MGVKITNLVWVYFTRNMSNKRSRGSAGAAAAAYSSTSSASRARKVGRSHPGYAYFEREMHPVLKPLNKLYNFPSWAMNPKHAEIDRSLMLRKVQVYLVEIGDHVVRTFSEERHAEAWEYVAEKAETRLRGPVLRRLYDDIVGGNQNGAVDEEEDAACEKDPGSKNNEDQLSNSR